MENTVYVLYTVYIIWSIILYGIIPRVLYVTHFGKLEHSSFWVGPSHFFFCNIRNVLMFVIYDHKGFRFLHRPFQKFRSLSIYRFTCKCNDRYIGESKRQLLSRIKEHNMPSRKTAISKWHFGVLMDAFIIFKIQVRQKSYVKLNRILIYCGKI